MFRYTLLVFTVCLSLFSCKNEDKVIPAPEIFLQIPDGGFNFDTDSVRIIEPKITYDINSIYAWTENGTLISDDKDYTFENRELGTYEFQFTVLTDSGDDTMDITVHSLDINSFEEFKDFNDNGYYNNPTEGFHQFKYAQYPCEYTEATPDNWNGFAISENASTSDSSTKGEFSVYGSSADDESDNFTVFKQMEGKANHISFTDGQSHVIKTISVNNCTRSYIYMQNGFNKKEGKDYFLLSIHGLDETGTIISGPVDVLLADYRPEATADKYIIEEWQKIDLRQLGSIHQLAFSLSSSRDDEESFELPMYFCLDNLYIIE
ncbi:DUF4465 domain-containing protein [Carboxylicivirga marina]|uniref:DUF4465 domain-containing protein n=1 Tax=Carboxylicivirga marina TaxID=2800988 RepID=A0ABS1HNG9_9BACT|nr:DUF4465 domain-containing protein [Carboxylicivirga marina]MBK3519209.1 DUF4465 domain-containing protein [Carboxylicivirga marina]